MTLDTFLAVLDGDAHPTVAAGDDLVGPPLLSPADLARVTLMLDLLEIRARLDAQLHVSACAFDDLARRAEAPTAAPAPAGRGRDGGRAAWVTLGVVLLGLAASLLLRLA